MKTFKEIRSRNTEQLDESLLRTGSVAGFAAKSKSAGNKSEQEFKRGLQTLQKRKVGDSPEKRLERLEEATEHLLEGLLHQRHQIGYGVAVSLSGHLMATKRLKQIGNKSRR